LSKTIKGMVNEAFVIYEKEDTGSRQVSLQAALMLNVNVQCTYLNERENVFLLSPNDSLT